MTDRFTLRRIIPNGGGTQDQVIAEPGGWVGHTIKLERHPEFHSLIENLFSEGKLIFIGNDSQDGDGGAEFIRMVERLDGVDAEIQFIAETAEDDVNFQTYFIGMLQLEGLEELPDNEIEVPVIRDDFWSRFLRHWDTKIDLTKNEDIFGNPVDPAVPITVNLLSQKVQQKYIGEYGELTDFLLYNLNTDRYGAVDFAKETLNEIDNKYSIPRIEASTKPGALYAVKYAGDYLIDLNVLTSTSFILGSSIDSEVDLFIQINNDTPIQATRTDIPGVDARTRFEYTDTLALNAGDTIRIYFFKDGSTVATQWGVYGPSYLHITADTVFPETQVQGFFIHDLFFYTCKRLGLDFYSEYLGNQNTNGRQYDETGCGSRFFVTKGLFIRGYTLSENPDDPTERYSLQEKGFPISLKNIWDGLNPILNLGLGYEMLETSPDTQVIRVEEKAHFYDDSTTSINFGSVYDISRNYDADKIFKSVKTGYKKWESEEASGIDDPHTKHERTIPFSHVGKDITLESEFIAASYAWEVTRRVSIEKSKDYKLDNDNFILTLNIGDISPEESPELYTPELDENFNSVSNLLHSDTRYNLILTPLRNLLRWGNYLFGCVQSYLDTFKIRFVSGEGNYDMISDYNCGSGQECLAVICDSISESSDIDLSVYGEGIGYLHLPIEYPMRIPMSLSEYKIIAENRKLPIGISKTEEDFVNFLIKEITFNKYEGVADILAWSKVFFNVNDDTGQIPSTIDPDVQDWLDYGIDQGYTPPSDEVVQAISDLVTGLKEEGIYQDLDLLYIFNQDGDASFATLNIIDPTQFKATVVNGVIHTPNTGFQGNGTDGYLNTGWIPDEDADAYTLDDGSAFTYVNNNEIIEPFEVSVQAVLSENVTGNPEWNWIFSALGGAALGRDSSGTSSATITADERSVPASAYKSSNSGVAQGNGSIVFKKNGVTMNTQTFNNGDNLSNPGKQYTFTNVFASDILRVEVTEG